MTKQELASRLEIDENKLNEILKSCAYTEIKNFNAVHENVIRSFIKRANVIRSFIKRANVIRSFIKRANVKIYPAIEDDREKKQEPMIVNDEIENIEVVTVPRKELIELISRAYHKGIEKGRTLFNIADKDRLDAIFEEAIMSKEV